MTRVAVIMGEYPEQEWKRRESAVMKHVGPGLDIGIVRVDRSPYVHGLTPADLDLLAPAYIEAFRRAEAEGFDAVLPFGALDIGVEGGRSAVSIPVVGPCEACLHVAAQLGDRIGLLAYHNDMIGYQAAIVRRFGVASRIAGWRATDLHLPELTSRSGSLLELLSEQARSLIEKEGADVIIPLGVSQCPVHVSPDALSEGVGVPVVDGIGAPIRMAALLAELGLAHSRRRWPAQVRPDRSKRNA